MAERPLVLFDDRVARDWRPFTLTRPAGELLFGTATLRARTERALDLVCVTHITADALASFDEPWAPGAATGRASAVGSGDSASPSRGTDSGSGEPVTYLLSRFVAERGELPEGAAVLVSDGRVVGCRMEDGAAPSPDFFLDPDDHAPDLPRHELDGTVIEQVWELMSGNADRVARDLEGATHAALPRDVHHLGAGPVSVGADVTLAPGVVLDTRHGPIRLDDGVTIEPFTRLVGPAWIGPGTTLLGGPFDAVSIGPVCKVHGEMEETVVLGYSNKAHDGFLGHAYLGMWVNLGALTTNSDLKNNYGTVRVWTPRGETDTGQRKIGCLLGDHVKTAIGTMLNTGTVIEAGSNIFGGMPPTYVPPFRWGDATTPYDIDRFLETARTIMARRDIDLSDSQIQLLREAARTG